jgi:hypothetical protein
MSMAALFAASAMWVLTPAHAVSNEAQAHGISVRAGHMLIPSGTPGQVSRSIDRAIARKQHAATPGNNDTRVDTRNNAVDAIYRIEPTAAPRKGNRVMT